MIYFLFEIIFIVIPSQLSQFYSDLLSRSATLLLYRMHCWSVQQTFHMHLSVLECPFDPFYNFCFSAEFCHLLLGCSHFLVGIIANVSYLQCSCQLIPAFMLSWNPFLLTIVSLDYVLLHRSLISTISKFFVVA